MAKKNNKNKVIKVLVLASFPLHYFEGEKLSGSRKTHVSSWNKNLFYAMSEFDDVKVTILTNGNFFVTKYFKSNNINFILYGRIPWIEKYFPFIKLYRVKKIIKKKGFDIVHGIGNEHYYPWIAINTGLPNIITIHGILNDIIEKPTLFDKIRMKYEKIVFDTAKNIIIVNEFINKRLNALTNNKYKTFDIPNAISENFFVEENIPFDKRKIDILMVGMIYPLKQTHYIVDIAESLLKVMDDLKIYIIGGVIPKYENYLKNIKENIRKKGLTKHIAFLGQKENNDLREYYLNSKILLHLSKYEVSSMVIDEARACGDVAVATDVGGVKYKIMDNKDGFLVSHKIDIEEISTKILRILTDKNLFTQISSNSFSNIKASLHPKVIAKKTIKAYKEVL